MLSRSTVFEFHPDVEAQPTLYMKAVKFAEFCFDDIDRQAGMSLLDIDDGDLVQLLIQLSDGIEVVMPNEETIFYRVSEEQDAFLAGSAQTLPEAAMVVRQILSANIWQGQPLPKGLRSLASSLVRGEDILAKRPGVVFGQNFIQRFFVFCVVETILEVFPDLPTGHAVMAEISACAAVTEAANLRGFSFKKRTLQDWFYDKKRPNFRIRAKALQDFFDDFALKKTGALKRLHPYGPFLYFPRSLEVKRQG